MWETLAGGGGRSAKQQAGLLQLLQSDGARWGLTTCAVLVGGSNGDGAWRGQVTIVELIDPRPYIVQSPVYGRLIYTVI